MRSEKLKSRAFMTTFDFKRVAEEV